MKKREIFNENMAESCERMGGKNCQGAKQYRADNRRIEKRRRAGYRSGVEFTEPKSKN